MFREFRYVGADLNLIRLKRAHAVNRWAAYAVEDITRMGWRDHSFAAVVCLEVIEHVPEAFRLAVLRELLRVVQPDGLLILSTPNGRITVWKRLLGLKCERSHERELSTAEVQGLIEGAGATLHRVETIDNLVLPASRVAAGVIHLAAGWPALRRRLQSLATKAGYETLLYVASPRPVGVGAVGHRKESAWRARPTPPVVAGGGARARRGTGRAQPSRGCRSRRQARWGSFPVRAQGPFAARRRRWQRTARGGRRGRDPRR